MNGSNPTTIITASTPITMTHKYAGERNAFAQAKKKLSISGIHTDNDNEQAATR